MLNRADELLAKVNEFKSESLEEIEAFRIEMLGKKGAVNDLMKELRNIPVEEKKSYAQRINILKKEALEKVNSLKEIAESSGGKADSDIDLSMSAESFDLGARHPISVVRREILDIFSRIGFNVSEGPEIEDDWHNFTALNFPEEHPARDMQDTFFIEKETALRTHTSSVQVRVMENEKPPIRTVSPEEFLGMKQFLQELTVYFIRLKTIH